MSLASKLTFCGSVVFTIATVVGVHLQQKFERDRMHKGVLNDQARIEAKKRLQENLEEYERQQNLESILKKEQNIPVSSPG